MVAGVFVRRYSITPRKDIPSLTLSPCQFKHGRDKHLEKNGLDMVDRHKNHSNGTHMVATAEMLNWSLHERVLATLSSGLPKHEGEGASKFHTARGKEFLINAWLIGQLEATSLYTGGMDVRSVIIGSETLILFEVTGLNMKETVTSSGSLEMRNRTGESVVELLYLLTTTFDESSRGSQHDSYELHIDAENRSVDNFGGLELALGKLDLGEPVSLSSAKDKNSDRKFGLEISSLSWMETATADVINRRYFLHAVWYNLKALFFICKIQMLINFTL